MKQKPHGVVVTENCTSKFDSDQFEREQTCGQTDGRDKPLIRFYLHIRKYRKMHYVMPKNVKTQ